VTFQQTCSKNNVEDALYQLCANLLALHVLEKLGFHLRKMGRRRSEIDLLPSSISCSSTANGCATSSPKLVCVLLRK